MASLAASSIDLEFVCYVEAASEDEERRARHRLNVAVARLAREMEIELAFPTRTVYLESGAFESGTFESGPTEAVTDLQD